MRSLFEENEIFNQPLNNWNVSNVEDIRDMFFEAESFEQNLGGWDISNVNEMGKMFTLSGMSAKNISLTFQGWAEKKRFGSPPKRNRQNEQKRKGCVKVSCHKTQMEIQNRKRS